MLTHDYTYTNLLDRSVNNAWTVEEVFSEVETSTSPSHSCLSASPASAASPA